MLDAQTNDALLERLREAYTRKPLEFPTLSSRFRIGMDAPPPVKVIDITRAAARASGIPLHDLISARRHRVLVHWRHAVMWLARETTPASLPMIGRVLGGRDHTTIMHGIRKVNNRPDDFASYICRIRTELEAMR